MHALSIFCLRLACGLSGALLVLLWQGLETPPQQGVNPRFYRTQFLTVFGLITAAALFLRGTDNLWLWLTVGGTALLAFLGSLLWSLEGAPAGRALNLFTSFATIATLCLASQDCAPGQELGWLLAAELSSAALLGSATTAMLMGHSYLIAPSMSLTPLLRLLAALFVTLAVRGMVAGIGLWFWASEHSLSALGEGTIFLPLRWGIGFVGPVVLGIMAWQTARIRATQSATGILYVVVILTFIGELVSQVVLGNDLLDLYKGVP